MEPQKKQRKLNEFFGGGSSGNRSDPTAQASNESHVPDLSSPQQTSELNCADTDKCNSLCCNIDAENPFRGYTDSDFKDTKTLSKARTRKFNDNWLKNYPWLVLCTSRKRAFCFPCSKASSKAFTTHCHALQGEKTFLMHKGEGFGNWKKALERFDEHQKSKFHRDCVTKLCHHSEPSVSVSSQLNDAHAKASDRHYAGLLKLISSLKYLIQQGLAIRGHDDLEGNLRQLMELRAEDCPIIKEWLSSNSYMSHDIINEIIAIMCRNVTSDVVDEIRQREFFSVIADETRDISGVEQMSFCCRTVDSNYEIQEDFLGLYALPATTAEIIFNAIKDVLLRNSVNLQNMRGQAYDGASNMAGALSGVARRFLDIVEEATFIHCYAHRLNLCLQEVTKSIKFMGDAQNLAKDLHNFINNAPKRLEEFKSLKKKLVFDEDADDVVYQSGIKPLCVTRFTVRTAAYEAIIANYGPLIEVLESLTKSKDETGAKASGILRQMKSFKYIFALHLSKEVYAAGEQTSKILQSKTLDAETATASISTLLKFLERMRTNSEFENTYKMSLDFLKHHDKSSIVSNEPKVPRASSAFFSDAKTYYRVRATKLLISFLVK